MSSISNADKFHFRNLYAAVQMSVQDSTSSAPNEDVNKLLTDQSFVSSILSSVGFSDWIFLSFHFEFTKIILVTVFVLLLELASWCGSK